jgi:hypothetical protein
MLVSLVVTLLVLGILLWGVNALPVLDATIKRIISIVVIVVAALYVLQVFGLLGGRHVLP